MASIRSILRGCGGEQAGSDSTTTIYELIPGDVIGGRFRIVRFVDRGGMGEVYEAEDLALRSRPRVALKILRAGISADEGMEKRIRFEREIEIGKTVTHPNVCRTYDLGVHARLDIFGNPMDIVFFTMEFLRGSTLAKRLRKHGPLAAEEALPVIGQITQGLQAIHAAGIVHRDLKPGNIMLVPVTGGDVPRVVITDFGMATRIPASAEPLIHGDPAGLCEGTPDYMSPEQVLGRNTGTSCDIYSLGLLIYRMLTGTLPFVGENAAQRMRKRLWEHPVPPRRFLPRLDQRWERAILKCLSLDPGQRFSSADEVVSALHTPLEIYAERVRRTPGYG